VIATGLVTENPSHPMAHGPTVAKEYGIPAVIGVWDSTFLITHGSWSRNTAPQAPS
jgi:pyruvate,water dikinase